MDKRLKQLNALYTFESAARHQSYSKAAQELFISQAAVSQQMRQLEVSLNEKLFLRRGRNMSLTLSGEKLYHACKKGFSAIIDGLNSIQCEGISGDLTITSTQAFCSLWLMPRLYKFSQLHPDINIRVLGSNDVFDLQKKHIDIAIRFGTENSVTKPVDLEFEDFGQDYVYPVCSPQLMEQCRFNEPKDLLQCRLISLSNERLVTWQSWFKHVGVEGFASHDVKTEVTSSDMALSAVLCGHGVALAASAMFLPYIKSGQLMIPFKIQHPIVWDRFLVYPKISGRAERIQIFVQWMQKEMAQSTDE